MLAEIRIVASMLEEPTRENEEPILVIPHFNVV
jgi:hypothetical protein